MKITVEATIAAEKSKVWNYYTNPQHIIHWNFADPSWHCPSAENDLRIGGSYKARMEAKDGSFGFDFEAVYSEIDLGNSFSFAMGDRIVDVLFNGIGNQTEVKVRFDAENENPIELQRNGWQSILNNFKSYAESL